MSLENLPGQLIALMLGWTFTVYLQTRSNDRAEALKRKDKIIDKLEALPKWLEDEIKKDNFQHQLSEESFAGHVGQIEIKIGQLNSHVGKPVVDGSIIAELMLFEIKSAKDDNKQLPYEVRDVAWSIIEKIESGCNDVYFKKRGLLALLRGYIYEFSGLLFALMSLASLAYFSKFIVGFFR
ncbi:hypothetical protein [Pseudomonas putida]|uniref:hypothetical protein n=1 Tax=Pseudomonas putida TaxID=303 RepID=UPI0027652226|nr:hypothetical protein [Pseudomonas putida]MDP9524331.1 hypothetical protein [Pseudomonas putida]